MNCTIDEPDVPVKVGFTGEWSLYDLSAESYPIPEDLTVTALYTSSNAGKGLSYSLSANGEEYTVSGVYEENEADITVAAIYKNKPVTKVKNSNEYTAFRGKIGTLVFPETIAELCQNTFHNCTVKRLILLNPKIVINLYLKPSISSLQIEELFYYGSASE